MKLREWWRLKVWQWRNPSMRHGYRYNEKEKIVYSVTEVRAAFSEEWGTLISFPVPNVVLNEKDVQTLMAAGEVWTRYEH